MEDSEQTRGDERITTEVISVRHRLGLQKQNKVGKWYQMDNGKIADIVGVAIKGRKNYDQWVKTFKVQYYDAGTWKDVDGGAIFTGNTDRDTQVEVKFATPVKTRYIRIYPQTWNEHMSLRAGLITNSTLKESELKLLNIPAEKRAASSWWTTIMMHANWHPKKGTLNSGTGWHPKAGAPSNGSESGTNYKWTVQPRWLVLLSRGVVRVTIQKRNIIGNGQPHLPRSTKTPQVNGRMSIMDLSTRV
jgi:hypothetical protein